MSLRDGLLAMALAAGCGYPHSVTRTAASGSPPAGPSPFSSTALYAGSDAREASTDQGGNVWIATTGGVKVVLADGGTLSYGTADGLVQSAVACATGGLPGTALVGFPPPADLTKTSPQIEFLQLSGGKVVGSPKTFALTGEIVQANHAAYDSKRNQYWIGTNEGVALYDAAGDAIEHRHPVHPHGLTLGVAITPSGDVWDADQFQLSRLNAGPAADFDATFDPILQPFPENEQDLSAAAVDAAGGVWVGSLVRGVARLDPQAFAVTTYGVASGLPSLAVQSLALDPDGTVWVATGDSGLARLDPSSGAWTSYRASSPAGPSGPPSGLPSDDVVDVTVDTSHSPRRVVVTTGAGVVAYAGP